MPTTAYPEEIQLVLDNNNIFYNDSLIIRPYEHFSALSQTFTTLSINQLNTYFIEFTPAATITPGFEMVL